MSFSRLKNDTCTYKYDLKQTVGPGEYMLAEPNIDCTTCFQANPEFRLSGKMRESTGVSICKTRPLIDIDSEMKNINRPATRCPTRKYRGEEYCPTLHHFPDCDNPCQRTEPTRYSNPPCTLRCTGWNRWEWLCKNPQENAMVPFDFNINGRLIAKDNHRPCIPNPIRQDSALPPSNPPNPVMMQTACGANPITENFSTHWRECKTYKNYM